MNKKEKKLVYKMCNMVRNNFIEKLERKYSDFSDETLRGWCYEASEELLLQLYQNNISADLIYGEMDDAFHYWLEYKGYIIDLTACQFNGRYNKKFPKILIKPISKLKCFQAKELI